EVDQLLVAVLDVVQQQDPAYLGHRLEDQDAGHDRAPRKLALEEGLVRGDVLQADGPLSLLDLQDAVDEEKRIAVRQDVQDRSDLHHFLFPFFSGFSGSALPSRRSIDATRSSSSSKRRRISGRRA